MVIEPLRGYNRNTLKKTDRISYEPLSDELDLHGFTADEALFKLDRYLNDAFTMGLLQVRVIHGKGTGTLRQVVNETLKNHPLVESYRPAGVYDGGWGATMVELVKY
jgi:DNA mismatch repair protein MutS2